MVKNKNRRKNQSNALQYTLAITVIVLLIGAIFAVFSGAFSVSGDGIPPSGDISSCPDDRDETFTLDVFNVLNESGSESFDITYYIFEKNAEGEETLLQSGTDTTSPTAVTLNGGCGKSFVIKAVSSDGASGDKSSFKKVQGGNSKIVDGNIEFTATDGATSLRASMEQHATIQCRAYDNVQKDLMYDSADATNNDYETDGVTFTSTTNNATASDETVGMDITFECKAIQSDTDYNDRGVLVLLELPTTKWAKPSVYADGSALTDVTSSLTTSEKDAYVDYEYAFIIPSSVVMQDGGDGFNLQVTADLKSGVTSVTNDPQIDLAVRGSHLSTDGFSVISGSAVTDATSPAQIYALYDITVDMT